MTTHHPGQSAPVSATRFVISERPRSKHRSGRVGAPSSGAHHPWVSVVLYALSALVMALILLALFGAFHAAAAALVGVPAGYISAGWLIVSIGALLFGLSARSIRAACARLSLVGGISFLIAGTVAASMYRVDRSPNTLPIEIPTALQGAWDTALASALLGIAIATIGLGFLGAWYFLRRSPDSHSDHPLPGGEDHA